MRKFIIAIFLILLTIGLASCSIDDFLMSKKITITSQINEQQETILLKARFVKYNNQSDLEFGIIYKPNANINERKDLLFEDGVTNYFGEIDKYKELRLNIQLGNQRDYLTPITYRSYVKNLNTNEIEYSKTQTTSFYSLAKQKLGEYSVSILARFENIEFAEQEFLIESLVNSYNKGLEINIDFSQYLTEKANYRFGLIYKGQSIDESNYLLDNISNNIYYGDLDEAGNLSFIFKQMPKFTYKTNYYFMPFVQKTDDSEIIYNNKVVKFNLFELAKDDDSDFSKEVIGAVPEEEEEENGNTEPIEEIEITEIWIRVDELDTEYELYSNSENIKVIMPPKNQLDYKVVPLTIEANKGYYFSENVVITLYIEGKVYTDIYSIDLINEYEILFVYEDPYWSPAV